MIGQPHPGLVSRDVVAFDGETATIREIWDLKAAGCPMTVVKPYPEFEIPEDATSVEIVYQQPLQEPGHG